MGNNEATPRPLWEFDPENYGRTMDWGYGITQKVDEGAMIAPSTHVFIEYGDSDEEAQDTGRELVKRWNAYDEHEATLTEARRVSGDNADIAVKAMGMLAECQQKLQDLADAFSHGTEQEEVAAYNAAVTLLAEQKETKLYD